MTGWIKLLKVAGVITAATFITPQRADAQSGSPDGIVSTILSAEEVGHFSKQVERDLAANGARLAIVFRSGRPREDLPSGIEYTHGSFWAYQKIQTAEGTVTNGYVSYNLYHGNGETVPKSKSYLKTDFPFDFINGAHEPDVAVIIPTPEVQRRILSSIADGSYQRLHIEDYSLVSNPYDARFQNCTEFLLDVVAAEAWQTDNYTQLKVNLRAHFDAQKIRAGLLARMFGPIADDRLKTADHRGGPIKTTTYATLANFMDQFGLSDQAYKIRFAADKATES